MPPEDHRVVCHLDELLEARGMTVTEDVDLAAFRKAGEKAYEALNLSDAKNALHKEMGK